VSLIHEEIEPVLEVAINMRKCVTDQLTIMLPAEFGSVDYHFSMVNA
jgi:hypothetical protein